MQATQVDAVRAGGALRSRWRVALYASIISLSFAAIVIARRVVTALFPYRSHVTAAQAVDARKHLRALEDVSFPTKDGLVLRGWFSPGKSRDAVVFVHGLTANRGEFLHEGEDLSEHGHGVLLYDSRASGESDGHLAT